MIHRPRSRSAAAAAVLLAAALPAAACSSGSGSGPSRADGGVLTYATNGVVQCLDPQASVTKLTGIVDRNVFDSLVSIDRTGQAQPWLAQKWTVSPDGRVYTFTLRPGVTFHDGTPLTAAAVKTTFDHAVDPRTRSLYAASLLAGYSGTKVVDDRTVEVDLARPHSPLLTALASPYLGIQSVKSLQNPAAACSAPVGTGPFRFKSWTKGASIQLTRNDAYRWGPAGTAEGPAKLAGITFAMVNEDSARYGALTSGQADLIDDVPATDVAGLKKSPTYRFFVQPTPGAVQTITFNTGRAPLDDERVRLALRQSIDIDQLLKSVYAGQFARAWSPLSPATPGYDASLAGSWKHDPAAAGHLLDEAGWSGRDSQGYRTRAGKRLTVRWPVGSRLIRAKDTLLAQGLQAEAKQAGIEVKYVPEDTGAFIRDVTSRNLDLYFESFRTASPDVLRYQFASDQVPAHGGANLFHLKDAALDRWLLGAAATTDRATQAQDYGAAQRYLVEHALVLPVYVPAELLGLSKKVTGLSFDNSLYPQFRGVTVDGS
jgi:peptide/nickel transport system substrate-binding protein